MMLALLGVANGVMREKVLQPRYGNRALPLSGITLALLILVATILLQPAARSSIAPWTIGLAWTVMTVGFECVFGRLRGHSWPEIGQAYLFAGGNLWSLDLLCMLVAPSVAETLRLYSA